MSVILNGTTQYLRINANPPGLCSVPITISAWIKLDNITAIHPIVGFDDGTADNYLLEARGTIAGDPIAAMVHHLGGSWAIADTTTGYSASTWTHVVVVFASTTSRSSYINGSSKGTDTTSVTVTWVGNGYWAIGSYGGLTSFAAGKIAEVAVWNKALTDTQVGLLAAGSSPNTIEYDNLKAWWPLLDSPNDVIGSFTLTPYNSPTYSSDHPSGAGTTINIDKTYSRKLVAVGNYEVWYESTAGTMTELTDANNDIDTASPLTVAEAFQKIFVANQTNRKIIDFANAKITTADVKPDGKVTPTRGTVLTGGTSGAIMVLDYITASDSACTLYGCRTTVATFTSGETVTGTVTTTNDVTFVLNAAEDAPPHWYDWTPYANDTTTYGSMPSSAYLVCRYRGRLVLSGHPNYPHQWYMAKVSNPFNWIYGSTDPLTAVAGNNVDAGEVGDIVRALIPYGDDFLIFGCANSIHIMDGDPAFGGSIDELSEITGIYGPWAWCKDENGNLYFWGTNGLYKMEGGRSKPVNISQGQLPKWADDWATAPATHRIVLTYDPSRNGIIISKTTLADGTNSNYWYDLKTEGFYPESYPTACGIFSSCYYDSDASGTRKLILGSYDGYLRSFYDTAKNDDSGDTDTAISSYTTLPIIKLSETEDSEGKLTSLIFELAGGKATTKLTHTTLTTAHAIGDTLTQATSGATMIVAFTDSTKINTYGYSATGTFSTSYQVTGSGSGTAFTPTVVGTGSFSDTDQVTYELHIGDDAETILENIKGLATARESGTLTGTGRQNKIRKRVRGRWLGIKLYNSTASKTWAINLISGEIKPAGK